jgi:hypothetical protein
MSDSASWVSPEICRRVRPTRPVSQTNSGVSASDSTVSCHESSSNAMTVLIRVTAFDKIVLAVSVMTDCRPPTSLASRLWMSPVRVAVKKRSDRLCRWV